MQRRDADVDNHLTELQRLNAFLCRILIELRQPWSPGEIGDPSGGHQAGSAGSMGQKLGV